MEITEIGIPDLIEEFRRDHRAVVSHLLALQEALDRGDVPKARALVDELDQMTGPHMEFEEKHLYPTLARFLGEHRIQELIVEHASAATIIRTLRDILSQPTLTDADRGRARGELSGFFLHAANCDGLSLLAERLEADEQRALAEKLIAMRSTGKPLTVYKGEGGPL